jgi:glycosyltransferase involved in cell wall biosynthesis
MHGSTLDVRVSASAGTKARLRRVTERPRVSVVVPARNEAANIAWVMERIPAIVDEVVLVDGDSMDGTVAEARRVRPDILVVGQDVPGKGAALRAGFAAATGDYVAMIDADCSMDPAELVDFVRRLDAGDEVVKGSRFLDGGGTTDMSWIRRCGNAGLRGLVNALYGARFTDLCYGYCAFRRDALERLMLRSDGFEIETEIVTRALRVGLTISEVPSFESPRANGVSNLNAWRDGRRVLRTLLRERFSGVNVAIEVETPAPASAAVAVDASPN